ncbi:DUF7281 domain-containing protein [Salinibacter ruber]|uniref:DUF7281 domain-containing protein n=1 Tax=Salinibacter ruber TaxID=146919 RepID=UPI0021674570|nr:hypothetical protein [Salinibacter ruber]
MLTVEREGGGRRLVVQNREMVQRFAEKEYPAGLDAAREADEAERLPASDAALHFRDAKRGSAGGEVVLFRGRPGVKITRNGTPVPIGELTQSAGVGAALLGSDTTLTVDLAADRSLAIVENQEAFLRFEELGTAAELACFAGGRLSGQVLEWLGSLERASGQIIHCPDYDPVGLSEFQRLRDACGDAVQLFWPDELEPMIKTYGKAALYRDSAELLDRLSGSSHPEVQKLLALLKRHGQGLEQEVLLRVD